MAQPLGSTIWKRGSKCSGAGGPQAWSNAAGSASIIFQATVALAYGNKVINLRSRPAGPEYAVFPAARWILLR